MIYHITHSWGGGTQKYIDELVRDCEDDFVVIKEQPFSIDGDRIKLVHIHSTMIGNQIGWDVLRLVELVRTSVLTVHDYQWLFPHCPNPTTEDFETMKTSLCSDKVKKLFKGVTKVFMHTKNTYDRYKQYVDFDDANVFVGHPCDIRVRYEQARYPRIVDRVRVGFLGGIASYKGYDHFVSLAPKYECHVYGGEGECGDVFFHGRYENSTIIDQLIRDGIHVLVAFSLAEETYCYALSLMINTGLPIVYLKRGAIKDRLDGMGSRFIPCETPEELESGVEKAVQYLKSHEGDDDDYENISSTKIVRNEFYEREYFSNLE